MEAVAVSGEMLERRVPVEITIRDIATEALDEAGNDVVRAAQIMEETIAADERKYRLVMDPLVASACYTAVSQAVRGARSAVWTAPNYSAGGNGSRVRLLSAGNLMMFPLPGGQYLRGANKQEVEAGAEFYAKQGRDMMLKGAFLAKVAEQLGDKTVDKVFTEESLRSLQAEVRT